MIKQQHSFSVKTLIKGTLLVCFEEITLNRRLLYNIRTTNK